ncbi:MAG: TRAP transporter small permease [Deltaproteobacteria bacterium]|jgi:TRAP-type C4-dicarboxylate transport system permease small subunit|nr:TRAP transporter small permease [Deltaproteobacteria bacterium]
MDALRAFNAKANKVICLFLLAVFSVMVAIVFAQVIFRYALKHPLAWSEELARYLFVWATFLGASVAFYDRTNINVSLFVGKIKSPRAQSVVMLLADIACMTFLGMYVLEGGKATMRIFDLGQFAPSMEWLPVGWIYLAIPLGSFFMLLNMLTLALQHLDALRSGESPFVPSGSEH